MWLEETAHFLKLEKTMKTYLVLIGLSNKIRYAQWKWCKSIPLSESTIETVCGTSALAELAPVIAVLWPRLTLVATVVVNASKVIAVNTTVIVAVLKQYIAKLTWSIIYGKQPIQTHIIFSLKYSKTNTSTQFYSILILKNWFNKVFFNSPRRSTAVLENYSEN
jgi:hypothetical protein